MKRFGRLLSSVICTRLSIGPYFSLQTVNLLEPRYQIPGRKVFSYDIIPKLYNEVRSFILDHYNLQNVKPSLTIDLWTSSNNDAYMSVTAHFLDLDFQRVNMVLRTSICMP